MSKIEWNKVGNRFYETGVSKAVLYPQVSGAYPKGVAWDGVIGVTESPSGAEPTALWAANIKHAVMMSTEEYKATIEAYMSPKEFDACDGSAEVTPGVTIGQQTRQAFGFSYVTNIGNDTEGLDHGYKLHIVYGCLASPSERGHSTINDSPEAETMSWEVSTTPVEVPGYKPTATFTFDSTTTDASKLAAIEAILYGGDDTEARLPLPAELFTLLGVTTDDGAEG